LKEAIPTISIGFHLTDVFIGIHSIPSRLLAFLALKMPTTFNFQEKSNVSLYTIKKKEMRERGMY
jgi:hypothetical protein